jgi:hypothetical protein
MPGGVDLLVLEGVVPRRPQDPISSAAPAFEWLPLAAVPAGTEAPAALRVRRRIAGYPQDRLRMLAGLDHLAGHAVDVVNLSLGPSASISDPAEPLQLATKALVDLGIAVVVAAGNHGPGQGSLGALARPPWVIAVGATDGEGQLLETSGRGLPGGPWPTVVCEGIDDSGAPPRPFPPSTSFAAPRASFIACWLKASFQLLALNAAASDGGIWTVLSEPVRLPVFGIADTALDPRYYDRNRTASQRFHREEGAQAVQVSRTEREHAWHRRLDDALGALGIECPPSAAPRSIKRAFELAARPIAARERYEVGAGFISVEVVGDFLGDLVPSRWLSLFRPEIAPDASLAEELDRLDRELGPVWSTAMVAGTRELFLGGVRQESVVVAD